MTDIEEPPGPKGLRGLMGRPIEEPPGQGSLLRSLLGRPKVEGTWFNKKSITLDGYDFVGCRFDECSLHVSSANFEITNCFIDDATTIYYSGDVVKVIRLFNRGAEWAYTHAPFFAPTRNKDGTISVGTGSVA